MPNIENVQPYLAPSASTISRRQSSPKQSNRPRTGALDRAKTACASCRRDNKKCSNRRPCDRCVQRGEKCSEVVKDPADDPRVKMRCKACRRDNKKCCEVDKRPCEHCRLSGALADRLGQSERPRYLKCTRNPCCPKVTTLPVKKCVSPRLQDWQPELGSWRERWDR